ncbi:MAG: sigma-70 family RNA polymerase sigma factor [Synergistes sp.]|nr:sigma-70 family RNA polymerase sigma factor [Synergistes sp.]
MREATITEVIRDFRPLINSAAARYCGRGAEFEDLVQEGCLAVIRLLPKCSDRKYLAAFLKNRLPGCVRDAAAKMRWPNNCGSIEASQDEDGPDLEIPSSEEPQRSSIELRIMIERALTPEELDITQALTEGFSQREIAEILCISQQAVSKRLSVIRRKLRKIIDELRL